MEGPNPKMQRQGQEEGNSSNGSAPNSHYPASPSPPPLFHGPLHHHATDTLMGIVKHYQTGESLSEVRRRSLLDSTFQVGTKILKQVRFASVDLQLHAKYVFSGTESLHDVDRRVCENTEVIPPPPEDRLLCSFGHISKGSYAAGYYGYKWGDVLAEDAFSAFEDAGLKNGEAVKRMGQKFRETILALGGGKAALQVFIDFWEREPSLDALLRRVGLLRDAA